MKKIFFSLLAIAALASCAKTEAVFTQDNSEIKIAPVTAMTTKAQYGVMNGAYDPNEDFSVFAYWAKEPAGSRFTEDQTGVGYYLNDVKFVNKGLYWGGETTQYWPKNGSLRFAAYSPAEITMTHNLATDVYTLADFTYVDNFANSYDILVAPTSESYTAQTAAQNVSVVFEHALSWLSFNVMSTAAANGAFTVHSVTVDNVATQGTMVADMTTGVKDWTVVDASKKAITAYAGNADVYTASKSLDQKDNLVLPQATTTVTITFTQNAKNDAPALANQVLTIPLTLDADQPWEAGKKYTYTIVFDLDEILINPSVDEWENVNVPEIDATATEVTNSQELVEAVAAGRSVRLTEDIALAEPVIVDPTAYTRSVVPAVEVTVDLNGKTITAPLFTESDGTVSEGDTDSYAFWVKSGAKLNIVGDGVVKTQACKYSIAVWADGGQVVINGGKYYNYGEGADLIYAKNGGKITINGGYFQACEKKDGVDGTNEKYSALNLHGGTTGNEIKVYGGSFYGFDPAYNVSENPAKNFCADGYGSYELTPGIWTVASKTAEIQVASEAALWDAATQGGNVVLAADINLEKTVDVVGNLTIDLNGKTVTVPATAPKYYKDVFYAMGTANLTINGHGKLISEDGYTIHAAKNSNVVLNDGYYYSTVTSVYATKEASVTINGGKYQVDPENNLSGSEYGYEFTLNLKDDTAASITVKGGEYYKFNPANNAAEGQNTNFVATGYKSVQNGDWYTVMAE